MTITISKIPLGSIGKYPGNPSNRESNPFAPNYPNGSNPNLGRMPQNISATGTVHIRTLPPDQNQEPNTEGNPTPQYFQPARIELSNVSIPFISFDLNARQPQPVNNEHSSNDRPPGQNRESNPYIMQHNNRIPSNIRPVLFDNSINNIPPNQNQQTNPNMRQNANSIPSENRPVLVDNTINNIPPAQNQETDPAPGQARVFDIENPEDMRRFINTMENAWGVNNSTNPPNNISPHNRTIPQRQPIDEVEVLREKALENPENAASCVESLMSKTKESETSTSFFRINPEAFHDAYNALTDIAKNNSDQTQRIVDFFKEQAEDLNNLHNQQHAIKALGEIGEVNPLQAQGIIDFMADLPVKELIKLEGINILQKLVEKWPNHTAGKAVIPLSKILTFTFPNKDSLRNQLLERLDSLEERAETLDEQRPQDRDDRDLYLGVDVMETMMNLAALEEASDPDNLLERETNILKGKCSHMLSDALDRIHPNRLEPIKADLKEKGIWNESLAKVFDQRAMNDFRELYKLKHQQNPVLSMDVARHITNFALEQPLSDQEHNANQTILDNKRLVLCEHETKLKAKDAQKKLNLSA